MENFDFINLDLWSGFFGTIIGAIIGGYIAFIIARFQVKKQEKQLTAKEKSDKDEKEVRLLWQIYFDIKSDCENSKLWEKYEDLLQKAGDVWGTPTAEYVRETLQYIMRDIKNFFNLLEAKENENKVENNTELFLLWERAGQLLIFLFKVYGKLGKTDQLTLDFFKSANDIYQRHSKKLQQK